MINKIALGMSSLRRFPVFCSPYLILPYLVIVKMYFIDLKRKYKKKKNVTEKTSHKENVTKSS